MAIRVNKSPNPSFETIGGDGGYTAVNTGISFSTTQAYVGTKSMKLTYAGNSAAGAAGVHDVIGLEAATTYTFSAYVYVPTGSAPVCVNAQGDDFTTVLGSPSTVYDAWERISVTFTTDAAQLYHLFISNTATSTTSTFYYADALLLEKSDTLGAYFDGNTVNTGYTYGWLGIANESESYEIAGDGGRVNRFKQPSAEAGIGSWVLPLATGSKSTDHAYTGTYSLKIQCNGSANAENAGAGVQYIHMTAGKSFTFSCYVWVPTGAPAVILRAEGFGMTTVHGSPSTLNDQWQRVSVTFTANTVPGSYVTVWALNNTATPSGGSTFYLDGALLEESGTLGSYFDGSTTASGYSFDWLGTAHESASYSGVFTEDPDPDPDPDPESEVDAKIFVSGTAVAVSEMRVVVAGSLIPITEAGA